MDASPSTPLRPDVNTSRLLRLLRPYTSHLGNLERSLRAETDHSAYPVVHQGLALTVDRATKPDAKRTYGKPKNSRLKISSGSNIGPAQGFAGPSSLAEDVFSESFATPSLTAISVRTHLGLSRYASSKNERTHKILQQATSAIGAFRRLCQVAKPQHMTEKGKNFLPPIKQKERSVPKLSTICANIIGRNLEGYVRAEWIAHEREKAGVDSNSDSGDDEEEEDVQQDYQDQSWRVERLQEWYDALPGHVVGTVLVEQAISLALNLPYHPIRTDVLWALLETVVEQEASDSLRPLLHMLVQNTINHDHRAIPLVLAGIARLLSPRSIPPDIERLLIPHMSNRRKYLAMCIEPPLHSVRCELAATMVASGLSFVYNTSDQRQIDDFDDHTARWITRWTQTTRSAIPEERTRAWRTLHSCLTDIGFLTDPLPVDNSPSAYLVAFTIALLDTDYNTQAEKASLRKALRCLRSNPGIDFNILHPQAVGELVTRLLAEPQWKTDCPHITRWFLAHATRIGPADCPSIAEWICELEDNMPDVEEGDTDTKVAYAKLGYVWDTTFDSWIKETPAGKFRHGCKASPQTSIMDPSSDPGVIPGSDDSGFCSGQASSPAEYEPTPKPRAHAPVRQLSSPVVKMHSFSSPYVNSPIIKSSITPRNIWKVKHVTGKSLIKSALITPLQPIKVTQLSTGDSIDPLDDIEELDRSTPVLPKRVIQVDEFTDASSPVRSPLEQDENDPLAGDLSDVSFDRPWPGSSAETVRANKRKAQNASSPLQNGRSKRQHLR